MSQGIPSQEIRRLFGPFNRPHYRNNVRHNALLRKALEVASEEDLAALQRLINLRVTMGLANATDQMGKVGTNHEHNGRRVSLETPPPDNEAQQQLRSYMGAYDAYFMKRGNTYAVRNLQAKEGLQAAEQRFHDWIVRRHRAAHDMRPRPNWALEPLPGFQRVRLLPPAPPLPNAPHGGNPVAARVVTNVHHLMPARVPALRPFPRLPTPPPSAPPRGGNPVAAQVATNVRLAPAHVAAIQPPGRPSAPFDAPLGSRLRPIEVYEGHDEAMRTPQKRKFLGVVDISDTEDEDQRPRKKQRFSGVLDLTN